MPFPAEKINDIAVDAVERADLVGRNRNQKSGRRHQVYERAISVVKPSDGENKNLSRYQDRDDVAFVNKFWGHA